MNPRAARVEDLPEILALLDNAGLPTAGVDRHLETFFVVEEESGSAGSSDADAAAWRSGHGRTGLVGVGGMEVHGRAGLLRSVAVHGHFRNMGIASAICTLLEEEAERRGIRHIFLLTETAEPFFLQRGYVTVARGNAPAEIASTEEFTTLCPESAVLMVLAC